MDGSTFDTWTRRRFGVALGGASLLGMADSFTGDAKGKKKKGKKKKVRCRKVLQTCDPNAKDKFCCGGFNCDVFGAEVPLRCCLGLRSRCDTGSKHCCRELTCGSAVGLSGPRCCAEEQDLCSEDEDCCIGLDCGQGRCNQVTSDRALKANFGSVDAADMLQRVRELPIATWNYTRDDPAVRHIGPMAQDFTALFGVGADDRHIHPLDGQGVALAAIQGLLAAVEELSAENAALTARIAALEQSPTG
jgi:Chaperone of endosialidase